MYIRNPTFVNVILVYLLLFVSGAQRYNQADDKYLILVFLIALAAWYLLTDRKISERYLLYMSVFVGLLFSLSLYTGGGLSLQALIATTMKFVLAYCILKIVGARFVETYINVVVFLATVSLLGYITDVMHLFDGVITKLPDVGGMGYEGVLYTFRHQYHPDRNGSIFYEPGAYQAFLNAALFFIAFARTNFTNKKKWIYIAILTTTLITASSTTGFVIFSILYVLFLYRGKLASFSQKLVSIGLVIVVAGVFSATFQHVIVVKLDNYLNPSIARKGWSSENRSFDLQTDLKIFKEHVFGLGYEEYKKEFSRIGRVDAREGSSNGVSSMFAHYGLPYALFMFVSYYWALKRLLGDFLLTTVAYIMFIMVLWGESYYQLVPISLSIIAAPFIFSRTPVKDKLKGGAGNTRQTRNGY